MAIPDWTRTAGALLFSDTIYENVARGLIGSPWEGESEERKRLLVKDACREAFADEFIYKLPEVRSQDMTSLTTSNS